MENVDVNIFSFFCHDTLYGDLLCFFYGISCYERVVCIFNINESWLTKDEKAM